MSTYELTEKLKERYQSNQKMRMMEAKRLEIMLKEVEEELEQAEEARERDRQFRTKKVWGRRAGEPPNPSELEAERYYQGLWEWKWKLERRKRELVRDDHADLEWMWTLERREREATKRYRPVEIHAEDRRQEVEPETKATQNRQHKKRNPNMRNVVN